MEMEIDFLISILNNSPFRFQIKEIAPEKSLPDTDRFWKHDIKVAREYNRRNTTVGSSGDMAHTVLSEWAVCFRHTPSLLIYLHVPH